MPCKPASQVTPGETVDLSRLYARNAHDHIPYGRTFDVQEVRAHTLWDGYLEFKDDKGILLIVCDIRELRIEE